MQCCLRDQRSRTLIIGFWPVPYMQRFLWIRRILWWYYGLQMVKSWSFWEKLLDYLPMKLLVVLAGSLLVTDWAFQDAHLIANHDTLFPINLGNAFLNFSGLLLPHVYSSKNKIEIISLNVKYIVFVLFSNEYNIQLRSCKNPPTNIVKLILQNVPTFFKWRK